MPRRLILGLIRLYRAALSPLLPPACRFLPTCSEYAAEAVRRHGAARGSWLAVRRLLRCHPLGGRGWDPVPPCRGRGEGDGEGEVAGRGPGGRCGRGRPGAEVG